MQFNHAKRLRHVIVFFVGIAVVLVAAFIGVREGRPERLRLVEGEIPSATTTEPVALAAPATVPPTSATTAAPNTTLARKATGSTAATTVPAPRASTTVAVKPSAPKVFAMKPASGPAGSDVTVSGAGCKGGDVKVSLLPLIGLLPLDLTGSPAKSDGTWSVRLTVPPLVLPGRYPIFAHCGGGGLLGAFDYQIQTFTVELPG